MQWYLSVLIPYIAGQLSIVLAYALMPACLYMAVKKFGLSRWDLPLHWYSAFIVCCGIGHLLETIVIWIPWYPVLAVWHLATGVVSLWSVYLTIKWFFRRRKYDNPEKFIKEAKKYRIEQTLLNKLAENDKIIKELETRLDKVQ